MNVTVLVDGSAVNSKIRTGIVPPDVPALRSLPLLIQTSSTTPDPGRWLHLHCSNLNNFRPISKRPFSARILEKVLAEQPLAFLHWNSILEKFQCGFRKDLNTENALRKALNDLLLTPDAGQVQSCSSRSQCSFAYYWQTFSWTLWHPGSVLH